MRQATVSYSSVCETHLIKLLSIVTYEDGWSREILEDPQFEAAQSYRAVVNLLPTRVNGQWSSLYRLPEIQCSPLLRQKV